MDWDGVVRLRTLSLAAGAAMLMLLVPAMPTAAQAPGPSPVFAKAVWVAESGGVLKLLAADGSLLLEISGLKRVQAVAIDALRATLWVVAGDNLLSYGFDGTSQLAIALPHGGGGRALLAVNATDGSLWLARDETLRSFSAAGQALQVVHLRGDVLGLSIDPGSALLWVATGSSVAAYDVVAGQVVRTLALGHDADVRDVSADAATQSVWVARQNGVLHFATDGSLLLTAAPRQPVRVAAGPNGDVWAATKKNLVHLNGAGQVMGSVAPFTHGGEISELITDPADGSAWAASEHEVAHAGPGGQLLRVVDFQPPADIRGLALYADLIAPQLQIVLPAPGSYVNTQTPTLQVSYSDIGSGVDATSLAFQFSGGALAASCTYGAAGATCTPGTPLPAGPITLTATVKDFAGNAAPPAAVTFTIDTTPPVVTILSPAAGLLTNQPQQTVVGAVSKRATVTVNGAAAVVTPSLTFTLPITLQEGPNAIVAVATDLAGNQGAATVQVTLDTIPPAAVDPQKVTVTTPAGGSSTVSAGPGSAEAGATVLLTDAGAGSTATTVVAADGSFSAALACAASDQIQIVLRDAAGNSSAAATVTVPGPTGNGLPPDPATVATPIDLTVVTDIAASTAFLYSGTNPIQRGAQAGAIDPFRVAVLRGSVHDRSGQPISGVAVKVLGRLDLGSTLTRADGMFDLAANGGGLVTVQFDKSGYLTGQRQVRARWRDYAWLPDVVLVPVDAASTVVDTARVALQVARGSTVQDQDGSRRATLLFPAGTTAQLVLPGGQTSPLPTLTVRATEYTVGASGPQAMPAPLPPSSAYTYAVELAADEAAGAGATVRFSQPVPFYLENFIGFPVGGVVPAGYYDRGNAAWVASDNGLVVKILSITAGLANLDLTGAGAPADAAALAALGITSDEQQSLATLYPVGQTLWRVPIRHFSSWDFNWPFAAPPADLAPPNPDLEPPRDLTDDCDHPGASSIGCENQRLGEDVPIVGTPFTLHYQGDRVPGRLAPRSVQITLSGPNPPAGLVRIDLEIDIAGRQFRQSFAPGANLSTTFAWDGFDGYGRLLQGEYPATITVANIVNGQYALPAAGVPLAFAQPPPGVSVGLTPARYVFSISRTYTKSIGFVDSTAEKLGGWMLSVHHEYDPATRTVWRGDGSRENADPIATQALNYFGGQSLLTPRGAWLSADGSFDLVYWGLAAYAEIQHVDRDGNAQTVYTNGSENIYVFGVARDKFGQLFFATCDQYLTQTEIRTVLFPGATSQIVIAAPVCHGANDFFPDNAGGFYLVNSSVYHLGPDGTFTTVVDASTVPMFNATSGALAPDGSLFIADYSGRLFRLDPSGVLEVVAGAGAQGFSGDGGPAIGAQLQGPSGVTVAPDGTLWVTDAGRLRRIDASGVIATVGGGGFNLPTVGGSPFDIGMSGPVRIDPNGVVYFVSSPGIWRFGDAFPGFATNDFVVASEDGKEVYRFSANGRHLATVDPVTGAALYTFLYDGSNLVTGIQDRDGRLTRIERDGQGNAVAIVSPDGQRTTLLAGPDGYLQTATNPAGEAVSFTYAVGGLMATQTDPRGFQSTYQYSSDGRLALDTDAAGGFRSFQRTAGPGFDTVTMTTGAGDTSQFAVKYPAAGGRLRQFTGPDGLTVRSAIAPNGQQTETWPDGSVMTTTLSADPRFGLQSPIVVSEQTQMPSGLTLTTSSNRSVVLSVPGDPLSLSSQTDTWTVNGQTSTRLFDRLQMRWTFQTPTGRQATAAVDSSGRPTLLQVGTFAPLQLSYDASGRLISATRASGTRERSLSFTYGADGRLQTIIDPLQRTFSFVWDAAGRLRSRTLPDGRIVGFSYDADGNLTSVTPPGRPFHAFAFTPVNLEQSYTAPDLGSGQNSTTYGYDLDRRLTKITRPDGSTIVLAYQQGRLSSLNYPEGAISLTYDSGTSLLRTVSGPGGEVLAYTSDGPLPIRTSWSGPVSGSIERSFNQDLRLSSQTVNGQLGVVFQYDNDGLLTQAGSFSVSRDPSSGLVTGTSLGAVTTSEIQDDLGELSSASAAYAGSEIFRTEPTRDAAGRIARNVETILGITNIYDYTYDPVGRLTDVALNGAPLSHYDYDTNSNRVATVEGSVNTTAAYDSQDRLLQWGDVTYAYSTSGDLASKTQNGSTVAYTYDALGNLLTVVDASGIKTEYIVDGQNRRVGKKVNGVLVQGFLWQDGLKITAELDGAGNIVSRFIFAAHVNVPDYMVNNGVAYRILTDHLGSPRLVVNTSTGEVAQRMDYDAWGAVVQDTNPGFQPFGFRGGLYDTHTGLVRFGARDYEPGTGRWTAKDPILFAGGSTDLYAYVADDPVNLTDPEGLIPPPPSSWPLPPGWDSNWSWRYPEGNSPASPRWFDPEGGEWRWHAPDKWHQDGHWDHNPWDRWNSPWRNIPHNPCPVPAPSPEPVPWWRLLEDAIPDPLPIIMNPCFFIPSLCLGTGTGAVEA
jgi:RHS repeat-associated protein